MDVRECRSPVASQPQSGKLILLVLEHISYYLRVLFSFLVCDFYRTSLSKRGNPFLIRDMNVQLVTPETAESRGVLAARTRSSLYFSSRCFHATTNHTAFDTDQRKHTHRPTIAMNLVIRHRVRSDCTFHVLYGAAVPMLLRFKGKCSTVPPAELALRSGKIPFPSNDSKPTKMLTLGRP